MSDNIEYGVSLYGFTQRLIEDESYGLEGMFKDLNALGVKRFELVGAQIFRNYPVPYKEEIDEILALCEKYDVKPFSYGGYIDMGKKTGHDMTDGEKLNEIAFDLMVARSLGCECARIGEVPVHMVEQVAMFARSYGIRAGFEIHAPVKPSDPGIQEYVREFERLNSPWIGFIQDFGCFIERPNELSIQNFLDRGAKRELLDFIIENRHNGYTEETMWEKVQSMGGTEVEQTAVSNWFGFMSFAPADLEGFKTVLPHCIYFHSKFYYINDDGKETTIPLEKILKMIIDSGYKGVLMSEFEGHAFGLSAFEQIRRHLKLEKEIIGAL